MARVIRTHASVTSEAALLARGEAKGILEAAHAEAARIIAEAERRAERLEEEAFARGVEAGRASVAALEARALTARDRALEEAEGAIVGLVTRIAERVLRDAFEDAPARIVPIARAMLDRVRRARSIEVRVHPDDAPTLERALVEAHAGGPRILPDASITRGGCVVTSELGTIDARLEVQLEAFERALRETT